MVSLFFSLFIFILGGCGPSSLEDYQKEGQVFCRDLTALLSDVHTREELLKREGALKKKFDELVAVIMDARSYQVKHPDAFLSAQEEQNLFSEELLFELKRVYATIEGGREVIERAQKEALIRLDGFEKKIQKKFKRM